MNALYVITKYLTFPGALLRGFWEQSICRLMKIPVENNKYLQTNEMSGHIEHEFVRKKEGSFWFAFIPGLLVFLAGLVFFTAPFVNLFYLEIQGKVIRIWMYIFLYVALSMFTNIFPSIEDAIVMWENYKQLNTGLKILFAPGAVIMYIGAFAEKYCITFVTNVLLAAVILFI